MQSLGGIWVIKLVCIMSAAIVILVVLIVITIGLFADRALQIGIEAAASKTLNVAVTVDKVDLSILRGSLGLENLVIDNPPGYQYEKLLELTDAKVAVDIGSLLGDVVNIKEIRLDGLNLVIEQRGISNNNLQDIIKSLPTKEEDEKKAEPKPEPLIDNVAPLEEKKPKKRGRPSKKTDH